MGIIRTDRSAQEFILTKEGVIAQFQEFDPQQFGPWQFSIAKVLISDYGKQRQVWMLTKGQSVFDLFKVQVGDENLFDRADKLSKLSFNAHRSNCLKLFSRLSSLSFEQSLELKKLLFLYQLDYVFEAFFSENNHTLNLDSALKTLIKVSDEQLLLLSIQISIVLTSINAFSAISLDI